uniref:Uncharacterized protein n=1 Tax=Arundo donax TaxID=35708 RepID=A0A0A8Y7M8_ARUDO
MIILYWVMQLLLVWIFANYD